MVSDWRGQQVNVVALQPRRNVHLHPTDEWRWLEALVEQRTHGQAVRDPSMQVTALPPSQIRPSSSNLARTVPALPADYDDVTDQDENCVSGTSVKTIQIEHSRICPRDNKNQGRTKSSNFNKLNYLIGYIFVDLFEAQCRCGITEPLQRLSPTLSTDSVDRSGSRGVLEWHETAAGRRARSPETARSQDEEAGPGTRPGRRPAQRGAGGNRPRRGGSTAARTA